VYFSVFPRTAIAGSKGSAVFQKISKSAVGISKRLIFSSYFTMFIPLIYLTIPGSDISEGVWGCGAGRRGGRMRLSSWSGYPIVVNFLSEGCLGSQFNPGILCSELYESCIRRTGNFPLSFGSYLTYLSCFILFAIITGVICVHLAPNNTLLLIPLSKSDRSLRSRHTDNFSLSYGSYLTYWWHSIIRTAIITEAADGVGSAINGIFLSIKSSKVDRSLRSRHTDNFSMSYGSYLTYWWHSIIRTAITEAADGVGIFLSVLSSKLKRSLRHRHTDNFSLSYGSYLTYWWHSITLTAKFDRNGGGIVADGRQKDR